MSNIYKKHTWKNEFYPAKLFMLPSLIIIFVLAMGFNCKADSGMVLTGTSICTTSGTTAIGLSETQANLYHALYRFDGVTYYREAMYFNSLPGPAISFGTFGTAGQYVAFTTLASFSPELSFTTVTANYTPIPGSVDIFAVPTANPGTGGNECDLDFLLNAVPSYGTGTWTYTGPGTVTFTPNANAPGATATVSSYGTYNFTWSEVNGLCSNNNSITVNFYLQPEANAGVPGSAACGSHTFTLDAILSSGTGVWSYTGPGTAVFSPDATTPGAEVTVSAFGAYAFTWTETNGTCSDQDVVVINFFENETAAAGPDASAVCGTKNYTLAANAPTTGQGTWTYTGPGTVTFLPDVYAANAAVTASNFGTYAFTWTIVNGNCTTSDLVNVTFPEIPTATLSAIGTTHVCIGQTASLTVALTGVSPWTITYTDGTTPVTVTGIIPNHYEFNPAVTSNKTYTISNVTDANGCPNTGVGSVKVYVGTITTIGAPVGGTPCIGSNVVIPVTVSNFDDVGAISLSLNFNPAILTYVSATSAFPAFSVFYNPAVPGVLKAGGFDSQPDALPDGSALFYLTFTYNGGTSALAWDNSTPESCEYASFETGLAFCDTPTATYYVDGSVTGYPRTSAVMTGSTTICDLGTTDLTINFTGSSPWTYSINGGTAVTTASNPETVPVTINGTTTYSITSLTDAHCTAFPADYAGFVIVTANPLPAAPAGTDVTVTYDQTAHAASATAPSGSSVVWYDAATAGSVTTAPTRTLAGTSIAWAESVNDLTACKSATRTMVTLTINQKPITGTFTVDATKVYDGLTTANVLSRNLNDVIAPDVVTLTGGTADYDTKHIGTGKTVTLTGMTLSGADAGNYTLTSVATTTADITLLSITGAFTVPASKVFDGTTSATILTETLVGSIGGDAVALTGGVADYDTKHIGTGKTVTLTGYALSGADAGNYNLTGVATTTADITALGLTGHFTVDATRVYDGGTVANVLTRTLTGIVSPDDVTLTGGVADYDTKAVGNGKTVTLTGMILSGADAGNYSLAGVTTTTADITALGITGAFTVAASKVYDGGTLATVLTRTLAGTIGGDVVSLSGGIANYDNKNVGTGKTVTLTGYSLSGADAGNYNITSVATTTAAITTLGITGNITVPATKVYDAGTSATVLTRTLTGVVSPDDVTLTGGVASYASKTVGVAKVVTLTGWSLTGVDAANYTIANPTTMADITALGITGSYTIPATKIYDGTTTATILTSPLVGVLSGDVVTLGGTANYDTRNFGTGKTVTFTAPTLSGADAGNYTVTIAVTTTTANITKRNITVTAVTDSRVYNGTTSSTGVPVKGTLQAGDATLTEPTQVYASRFVGTGKTLRASGWVINDGNGGLNYSVTYTNNLTGVISAKGITGSFTAANKVYDGLTLATVLTRTLTGVIGADIVNLTGGTANFINKNSGNGKLVTLTGATLTGLDAGNYSLTSVSTTTANITVKTVVPAVTANNKCFDGNVTATLLTKTLTGVVSPDVVTLNAAAAAFDNSAAGTGKTVTATGLTLAGADAGNYELSVTTATTTATIYPTPAANAAVTTAISCNGGTGTVTITATAGTPPFSYTFNGVTNGTGVFTGIVAGTNYPWSVTASSCGPATGTLTVTQPVAISVSGKITYYNTANTNLSGVTVNLQQGGNTILTATTNATGNYTFANVCPGTYDIVASSAAAVGGINITDAALVNAWGVTPSSIEKVKFYAGDVILSNRLDASDAGRIMAYFMNSGTPGWAVRAPWTFWLAGDVISSNPAPSGTMVYPTVTVNPLDLPITGKNLYALVTGDFNRSFVPSAAKSASKSLQLNSGNARMVNPGTEFELPVYAGSTMEVGAISLIMNYPSDKIEVTGAYLGSDAGSPVMYNASGNELRIGWNSTMPLPVKPGDKVLTLKLKIVGAVSLDETLRFSLAADPLNELADGNADVINDAVLYMDMLHASALGISNPVAADAMTLGNYPNPFAGTTTFAYSLPVSGKVTIEVFNMLGNKLVVLANQAQTAGDKTFTFDAGVLKPGVYTAVLKLITEEGKLMTRTIKIVRNQ
jgi:hypothetical protein